MPEWLQRRAQLTPAKLAVVAGNQRLTFGQLERAAATIAAQLSTRGVSEGAHVAVSLPSSLLHVVVVHALTRRRAVLIPINSRLADSEVDDRLFASRATFLITDSHFEVSSNAPGEQRPPIAGRNGRPEVIAAASLAWDGESSGTTDDFPLSESQLDLESVHSIVFTSGTSGNPKGVMLTYGNYWWNAVGSLLNLGLTDEDRWLLCIPLFHVGGLSILLRSVIYGIPTFVHQSFDSAKVSDSIDQDGITIVSLVPTMLQRLLDHRGDRPFPPSLRCVLLGGAKAPHSLLARCLRLSVPIFKTYGLTETASQVATLAPGDAADRMDSSGKALFLIQVRVGSISEVAAPGHVGEILVRGPTVMPGYFLDDEATSHAISDGWLHTGDMGYLDSDGFLYVLDRKDDLIITGGENVYPAEVEQVLQMHPAVQDVAVFGVPDAEWGQSIHAAVVLKSSAATESPELLAFCREKLAAFKVPKKIHFREVLPRNPSGKLMRDQLPSSH